MGRLSVAASVSAWVSSSDAEEAAAIAEHASTSGYASLWSALRGTLGMLAKAGKTRSAALELALALVLEQNPCVTGDESIQETADILLVIARDDDRSDIRVVALRVAAEVLAVRWRTKLQNFDSGISKVAASLIAAASAGRYPWEDADLVDEDERDASLAVIDALDLLTSTESPEIADSVARRVANACEKVKEFLSGDGARGSSGARGFAIHSETAGEAVKTGIGLLVLSVSSGGRRLPVAKVLPQLVLSTCVIMGAAEGGGDADVFRDCRRLLSGIAQASHLLPDGLTCVGYAAREAVLGLENRDEEKTSRDEVLAILKGVTVLAESIASGQTETGSKKHHRVFNAVAHALIKQLEPPSNIVASTARGDPALDLIADPLAAASAPQLAEVATARIRALSAIISVLPAEDKQPSKSHKDNGQVRENKAPETTKTDTVSRRPLIIELIDDENEEPTADDDEDETLDEQNEVMSLAAGVAMTAAAYCRGGDLHGAGGLPKWSSNEASAAARSLVELMFDHGANVGAGESPRGFGDAVRDCLARCLGETAASLAFSLAIEPEPQWGGSAGSRDDRKPRPPAPELPPHLPNQLAKPTTESAFVASVRLRWMIESSGYPWLGKADKSGNEDANVMVSRVVPCVLRAMDHTSSVVRREGCAALVALISATNRTELRWHGAALLDAASLTFSGSTVEVFGAAAAAHTRVAVAVCADDPRDPVLMSALEAMIQAASSRNHEVGVAKAWVIEFPTLLSAVKLSAAAHLPRLFPVLLDWLHARDDSTAIGAASCLELLCTMTWPRVPNHAASLWPDISRAYTEADARGGTEMIERFRSTLERLVAIIQLASGEKFDEVWREACNEPIPAQLAPLISYLENLPAREGGSNEWHSIHS